MQHPAQSRRLRLERATERGDLDYLYEQARIAAAHCGAAYQRQVALAIITAEERVACQVGEHPDVEDGRCLLCGEWVPPYDL